MFPFIFTAVFQQTCSVTILATIVKDRLGNPLTNKNIKLHNYKYIHRLNVDSSKLNDSEIIYSKEPIITVKEKNFQ